MALLAPIRHLAVREKIRQRLSTDHRQTLQWLPTYGGQCDYSRLIVLSLRHQVDGQAADACEEHVAQQAATDARLEHHKNANADGNRFECARHSAVHIYIAAQVAQMQRQAEVDDDQGEPNEQREHCGAPVFAAEDHQKGIHMHFQWLMRSGLLNSCARSSGLILCWWLRLIRP